MAESASSSGSIMRAIRRFLHRRSLWHRYLLSILLALALVDAAAAQTAVPLPLTVEERESVACLTVGTIGTSAAAYFGNVEIVNIIAGGTLLPTNAGIIAITLIGVVFLSYCEIGVALNPLVERVSDDVVVAWNNATARSAVAARQPAEVAPASFDDTLPWEKRRRRLVSPVPAPAPPSDPAAMLSRTAARAP